MMNGFAAREIVGSYFESLGYNWIHRNYDVFGANFPNKYPRADEVMKNCIGKKRKPIAWHKDGFS